MEANGMSTSALRGGGLGDLLVRDAARCRWRDSASTVKITAAIFALPVVARRSRSRVGVRSPLDLEVRRRRRRAARRPASSGPWRTTSAWVCTSMATRSSTSMVAVASCLSGASAPGCRRSAGSAPTDVGPGVGDGVGGPAAVGVGRRGSRCGCDQSASRSPPMPMAWPVIRAAASEARKATRPATSSGVPKPSPLRERSRAAARRSSCASTYGREGTGWSRSSRWRRPARSR